MWIREEEVWLKLIEWLGRLKLCACYSVSFREGSGLLLDLYRSYVR